MAVYRPDLAVPETLPKTSEVFESGLTYGALATPVMAYHLGKTLRHFVDSYGLEESHQLELPPFRHPQLVVTRCPLPAVINFETRAASGLKAHATSIVAPESRPVAVTVRSLTPRFALDTRSASHYAHPSTLSEVRLAVERLSEADELIRRGHDYKVRPRSRAVWGVLAAALEL